MEGLITVRTRAEVAGETEEMELQTDVTLTFEDDRRVLRYTETPPEGNPTAVTVTERAGRVQVKREGDMRATLRFVPGTAQECRYETPFGLLYLCIHTRQTDVVWTKDGGTIRLDYDLEDATGDRSRHEVEMAVRVTERKGM